MFIMLMFERNDKVLNGTSWPPEKMYQVVWAGIIGYGRVEWSRVKITRISHPDQAVEDFDRFRDKWGRCEVFATFTKDLPNWQSRGPEEGFV